MLTGLAGAVAGVVGSGIGRVGAYFERKQEIAAESAKRKDDMELAKIQTDGQTAVADLNTYTALRKASYDQDMALGTPDTWVVDVLRLIRPVITVYALILETAIYCTSSDEGVKRMLVTAVVETASMTITWWFGDRYKKGV